jgi:hypothetical protein
VRLLPLANQKDTEEYNLGQSGVQVVFRRQPAGCVATIGFSRSAWRFSDCELCIGSARSGSAGASLKLTCFHRVNTAVS